jgi:hypothetical protein
MAYLTSCTLLMCAIAVRCVANGKARIGKLSCRDQRPGVADGIPKAGITASQYELDAQPCDGISHRCLGFSRRFCSCQTELAGKTSRKQNEDGQRLVTYSLDTTDIKVSLGFGLHTEAFWPSVL